MLESVTFKSSFSLSVSCSSNRHFCYDSSWQSHELSESLNLHACLVVVECCSRAAPSSSKGSYFRRGRVKFVHEFGLLVVCVIGLGVAYSFK